MPPKRAGFRMAKEWDQMLPELSQLGIT